MAIKRRTENVTKYTRPDGFLFGTVHPRLEDGGKWQFTNFMVTEGKPGHAYIFETREAAEARADQEFMVQPGADVAGVPVFVPALQLWRLTRTSPDYEEMTDVVVVAASDLLARLAAVQRMSDTSYAADFAIENASTVELIGTALEGAEPGSLVFRS